MDYRTDRQRALGLGASGEGSQHWWSQRVSSIALVILTPLFLWIYVPLLGADHADVRQAFGHPFRAIAGILFIMVLFHHLRQGLQVVIEDYVHNRPVLTALTIGSTLFCWAFGVTGVFAIASMAFGR
ncbi:MAG: succinate dehydrogenase, hydrophobic membrane anchor protein [Paracoccaceae bacterium]|nr:succinate dehydrogenase, hydrophobic membrane anchor protein [Paracoccaceae bacterium]MDE2911642.1 succinate dehydrogenase, hydrophobic membrane anchor protein [Paracoccaceae bacterium]